MTDEDYMTSKPCDDLSVVQTRVALNETLQRSGVWNDECQHAADVHVTAMLRAGLDEEAIRKELQSLGVSDKGAVELIYKVRMGENFPDTEQEFDKAVFDRSGLRLFWAIVLCLLVIGGGLLIGAASIGQLGAYSCGLWGALFLGAVGCVVAYIRNKVLND
ncbi:MAG: hypothetical protein QGG42_07975 [Phycisphaerae bacterium]|jgi:hypothetical protein|nr:hypothetical protein [Phycisphaerae bacterium]